MLFFRVMRHLLPRSILFRVRAVKEAWTVGSGHKVGEYGLTVGGLYGRGRTLERLVFALSGALHNARQFVDLVWLDIITDRTRQLDEWEDQLGLLAAATESDRRLNTAAARASTGGQGPGYLQSVVQAAGFDLYLTEWFQTPSPYDPRAYTVPPTLGTTRCGDGVSTCGNPQATANAFLSNEPLYLHNKSLDQQAPPRITGDSDTWRYYLYWSAATFPNHAQVPVSRRQELERLLLKICPAEQVLVVLVDYV